MHHHGQDNQTTGNCMTDQEFEELKEEIESAKSILESLKNKGGEIAKNRAEDYLWYMQSKYKTAKKIKSILDEVDSINKEIENLEMERKLKNEKDI
jgi:flagellin-specific chaperone FliS